MGTQHSGKIARSATPTANAMPTGTSSRDPDGPGDHVMSCAALAGDTVVNHRSEDLGKLAHVMIDMASGRVAYAVVSHGGVFGIGERLFPIPWRALTLDAARKCFVLDVDRDRFDKAPGFDPRHWPAMGDAAWAAQVHDFYGTLPARDPNRAL